MNYVEVKGGLGNQLFQYTFHKYCEKRSGHVTLLHTDFFKYVKTVESATKREFVLNKFYCDYAGICGAVSCSGIVKEDAFSDIHLGADEIFYSGYWQSKLFFEDVRQEIIHDISLKEECISHELKRIADEIKKVNSIAIHIRRGDYLNDVNSKIFNALTMDYYKNALLELKRRGGENLKAFLFTEDTEYASEILNQFGDVDIRLMQVRADYEDLYLMAQARHHIIANSSFSWWGAALSKGDKGVTVAPQNWFLDRSSPNLYLDDWIVL